MLRLSISFMLSVLVFGLVSENGQAQVNPPVREYTNPDEMVTLAAETTFPQTFQILGNFSRRFANKTIVDTSNRTGTIGFTIPFMHWRQALEYVANAHKLAIREYPDRIELVLAPTGAPLVGTPAGQGAASEPVTVDAPTTRAQRSIGGGASSELMVDLDTREVEISAIFFEANRRVLRELGLDWSFINEGVVNIKNLGADVSFDLLEVSTKQDLGKGWNVEALFRTLDAQNDGKILATPRIKVIDGQEGDIQVGQDISIKQRDFAGNVTDQFFKTGTILTVTPYVVSEADTNFIVLDIKAERSTANPDPVSTIINKQTATTKLLLFSGESAVIAGLYETEVINIRRGIPFLKDLPPWVLGLRYIFGFNSKDFREKELIVVIKADLVPSLRNRFYQRVKSPESDVLQEGRDRIRSIDLKEIKNQ
jgi:type IV pilus assembly protein PilQ